MPDGTVETIITTHIIWKLLLNEITWELYTIVYIHDCALGTLKRTETHVQVNSNDGGDTSFQDNVYKLATSICHSIKVLRHQVKINRIHYKVIQ